MNRLGEQVGTIRDDLRGEINTLRNDRSEFYRTQGQHEVRLDNLEKE